MKKFRICWILLLLGASACYKDLGNYHYHAVNQVTVGNFDTVKGYTVLFNDTLTISPTLTASLNANAPAGNYTFQWSVPLINQYQDTVDTVIAVTPVLHIRETQTPGNYILTLRITDKSTGLTVQERAPLLVTSLVYEGFMVLNDVGGSSRLDMLSYNSGAGTFTQITDVLQAQASALTLQGSPYQVFCGLFSSVNINPEDYGIYVLTSAGANRVDQETLGWNPSFNVAATMIGAPADFAPKHMWMTLFVGIYPDLFLWADSNMYNEPEITQYVFKYVPINQYSATTPFPAAPFVGTDGNQAVLYDVQARQFALATAYNFNGTNLIAAPANDSLPTGKDMVYMEHNYSGNCYAILKDTTSNPTYYMLRWPIGGAKAYYQPLQIPNIASATHFAVSPQLGYLFYSIGGQVYEYDLSLRTSKLMLDEGSNTVSYLAFNTFYNMAANTTYAGWAADLLIGVCDQSGANGTLGLYTVPTVNGQIQPVYQWSGFGKIVSVSYRER